MNPSKHTPAIVIKVGAGLLAAILFLLCETSLIVRADPGNLFVKPGATGNCSQSNPCNLQTALSQAVNGDILYLAQGSYTGTGETVVTVTKNITLYGGWDGTTTTPVLRNPDTYPSTLNGQNARRVISISENSSPIIDGFIITGGKAPDGGGIYILGASPTIQNNVITANQTTDSSYDGGTGGGICVDGEIHAVIVQNRITGNTSGYGGGIYHYGYTAITILANEITGNTASYRGGGILLENSPDIVLSNLISDNSAGNDGGGILIWHAASRVEANYIFDNSADVGAGISMGNNATPSLYNNWLIENTTDGIHASSSSPVIVNNTIVGSGLAGAGYGIDLYSSPNCTPPYCTTGSIVNNIIIKYEIGIYGYGPITPVIDYNDVWSNTTANYSMPSGVSSGAHSISMNPFFVNLTADDYHLRNNSPCINTGDPAGVPPAPSHDIDGDPRPLGNRVDIGADEFGYHIYIPVVKR